MKTLIIGGGVIGLSCALEQLERGHEVEVLEAREAVGLETSFANGGMITPSMPSPWNAPGVLKNLFAALFDSHSPMKMHFKAIPGLTLWGLKFLRHSNAKDFLHACTANFNLSQHSLELMRQVKERHSLDIDHASAGTFALFRDKDEFTATSGAHSMFDPMGLKYQVMTPAEAVEQEPFLAPTEGELAGAVFYPGDDRGDCFKYCQQIAAIIEQRGGIIRTGVRASSLDVKQGRVRGVLTDQGTIEADRVVVAVATHTPRLARTAGVSLGIKPGKGYSITVPVEGELPRAAIVDASLHMGLVPMGDRLRVGGGAEFAGMDDRFHPHYRSGAIAGVEVVLPTVAPRMQQDQIVEWTGFRPITADGIPYVGGCKVQGLYINAGHTHLGWTMSQGAAHLLSDIMDGQSPAIDPGPYRIDR